MPRVRGVLFIDYVRMLRRRKSTNLHQYLKPEDVALLVSRIELEAWYPMATFERLGLAILGEVVGGQVDAIRLWGRTQILEVLKLMPEMVTPDAPRDTVIALTNFLQSFFDFPAIHIDEVTDENASVTIAYGMCPAAEEAACWQTMGFFEALVEQSGAAGARGRFASASWRDPGRPTELALTWGQAPAARAARRVLRVLVVDDKPLVLAGLRRLLGRESDVSCASTAREALELLGSGPIDAVLCELELGGTDGLVLLEAVAQRWPATLRILHAGAPSPRAQAALAAGVLHAVAEKPVSPAELRRIFGQVHRAGP